VAILNEPKFERSPHLVALVAEVERLAAVLDDADTSSSAADDLRARACVATLRLDGSTITGPPIDDEVDALQASVADDPAAARSDGTWLDALQTCVDLDDADDEHIWALEYLAVADALAADDLTASIAGDFVAAVTELHRRLTRGLVAPGAAGVLRQSDLAVQDGSIGRIIYFPSDPADISRDLHLLAGWLESTAAREHGLVTSGVALYELLRIHPFLSANGRLARTGARLLLRDRGLDPAGLAVAEIYLADDPMVSYQQVARSMRRRDLTIWLETWSEAVAAGLQLAVGAIDRRAPDVPDRAVSFLRARTDAAFTIADYRADAVVGPDDSRADLQAMLDAGMITRVLGARGLRFRSAGASRSAHADV